MLSVILPTYNEADNVRKLVPQVRKILKDMPHEIILVDDDSPDETWKVAYDLNIRVKRRRGVRGLASAVVEGFMIAKGDVFVVMDSDMQHDPNTLCALLRRIEAGSDIAIASRYLKGGSTADWRGYRRLSSRMATLVAKMVCPRGITDPLSGFFAIRSEVWDKIKTSVHARGFKILLEIIAKGENLLIKEVPLQFGLRTKGVSKLSLCVQIQFFVQMFHLFVSTSRGQFRLFLAALLLIGVMLFSRVWALHMIYSDDELRARVQKHIENMVHIRGWLLSDVSLTNVTRESARILHRSHVRGPDPPGECIDLQLDSDYFQPCGES